MEQHDRGRDAARYRRAKEARTSPSPSPEREENLSLAITSLARGRRDSVVGVPGVHVERSADLRARELRAVRGSCLTQAHLEGDQQAHMDADLFIAYAEARVELNAARPSRRPFPAYDRFPPRLRVATAAWPRDAPVRVGGGLLAHPLAMPEYRVEATERGVASQTESDQALAPRAAAANHETPISTCSRPSCSRP